MKSRLIVMTLILIGCGFFSSAQTTKLKKAFNGKNLKGWVEPENNIWWKVNDGILSVQSDPDKTGSILWTEKKFEDFVIETDFKFGEGTVDSGIFLRTEKQQIQIGISGSLKRDMTGSPYIPGKGYPVEAENIPRLLKMKGWNTMKVQAVKKVYTVWLNGEQVLQYESENAIDKGPIGLQLHPGKDMAIDFRNIMIGEI
ncbi:DUF1080 domain-containing protein [Reichenbachiella sp. MALMAid0571]|uniref:3-keto-disaccharide hydrolase n=1 Tax=Reichenbachiella sp. MALMAid0571 TaxID=3143939 RepID=UPI0032DE602C